MLPTIFTVFPTGDINRKGVLIPLNDISPVEIHTAPTDPTTVDHVEVRVVNSTASEATLILDINGASFEVPIPAASGIRSIAEFDLTDTGQISASSSVATGLFISALVRRELDAPVPPPPVPDPDPPPSVGSDQGSGVAVGTP